MDKLIMKSKIGAMGKLRVLGVSEIKKMKCSLFDTEKDTCNTESKVGSNANFNVHKSVNNGVERLVFWFRKKEMKLMNGFVSDIKMNY